MLRFLVLALALAATGACGPARLPCAQACAGCCAEDGSCRAGTEAAACGASGAACTACGAGLECSAGACAAPFDAGAPGTLWVLGDFTDAGVFDVARVSERQGVSAQVRFALGDGGVPVLGSFAPADDGQGAIVELLEPSGRAALHSAGVDGALRGEVAATDAGRLEALGVTRAGWALWVAYQDDPGMFARPLDGGQVVRLTPPLTEEPQWWAVNWSADGRRFGVTAAPSSGLGQAWVTNLGAAAPAPVEVLSAAQLGPPDGGRRGVEGAPRFVAPDWVVLKVRLDQNSGLAGALPDGGTALRLVRVRLDGSGAELVPNAPQGSEVVGAWGVSNDGLQLAFARAPAGSADYEVYVMPAGGSAAARRVSAGNHARAPWPFDPLVFSPDGTRLAFAAQWAQPAHEPWLLATDGSVDRRLALLPAQADVYDAVVWAPDGAQVAFLADQTGKLAPYRVAADATAASPTPVWPVAATGGRALRLWWTP